MRDKDLELIAALVEGRLDDETEARALIASSAEAREEYEAQKRAYESLAAMGTAHLTETERATLHRDLWTELRGGDATKRTKAPWYVRWSPVAAGLFVVVGIAAVLSGGGGDAGQSSRDIVASGGEESATTTAAADAGGDSDLLADDGEATDTTEAATEGTTAEESAPSGVDERFLYAADAARVRAGDFSGDRLATFAAAETDDSELQMCVDDAIADADLDDYEIAAIVMSPAEADPGEDPTTTPSASSTTSPETPEVAIAVPDGAEPATAPLAFVDVQTCQLVYLDQP